MCMYMYIYICILITQALHTGAAHLWHRSASECLWSSCGWSWDVTDKCLMVRPGVFALRMCLICPHCNLDDADLEWQPAFGVSNFDSGHTSSDSRVDQMLSVLFPHKWDIDGFSQRVGTPRMSTQVFFPHCTSWNSLVFLSLYTHCKADSDTSEGKSV